MLLPRYFILESSQAKPKFHFLVNLIITILVGSHQKLFNFFFCLGLQEPLRVALLSHLRSLVQNLISNSETAEQIIQILVNDNLDLGCALTETVATRKVVLATYNFFKQLGDVVILFFCPLEILLFLVTCYFYILTTMARRTMRFPLQHHSTDGIIAGC